MALLADWFTKKIAASKSIAQGPGKDVTFGIIRVSQDFQIEETTMTIEDLQLLATSPNQEIKQLAKAALQLTSFAESLAARIVALEEELRKHRTQLQTLERNQGLQ